MLRTPAVAARQMAVNYETWRDGNFVRDYSGRALTPAEVLLLSRYREPLSGRTLELGCGAGRVLGYLVALGQEAHGVDLSPRMIEYCRATYPAAHLRIGDITHPQACADGRFDAIWATNNVLDVLDDASRRRVLAELADMIGSNGVLIFSSHNLDGAAVPSVAAATSGAQRVREALALAASKPPSVLARRLAAAPARRRNRRRLSGLSYRGDGYAVLNDEAHDYALLHYYIRRDDQERQLADAGYGLIEVVDASGDPVATGQVSRSSELHYVAYPK